MKRFIMILVTFVATLFALLLLSSCNKVEKSFIGAWSYEEGMMFRDYYYCVLNLKEKGNLDFRQIKSDRYGQEDIYLYGTWSVVNDSQISCHATDEDGDTYFWTFRLTSSNCLYWVGESMELHKY